MSMQTFPLILKETYMITPTVRHFAFMPADEQAVKFVPGQFITIHFKSQTRSFRRSYSIATMSNGQDAPIEFAASYIKDGPGSEFLFNLKGGDRVETSGPFGRLVLRDEAPSRYILIATGTGVTPYRAMLAQIRQRLIEQPNLQVVILLGVRNREELLYGSDFMLFASSQERFQFVAHYSRETRESLKAFERAGYVQTGFDSLALSPHEDIVYLCGNPDMIDEAFVKLRALGFETANIRREKYVSSTAKSIG